MKSQDTARARAVEADGELSEVRGEDLEAEARTRRGRVVGGAPEDCPRVFPLKG